MGGYILSSLREDRLGEKGGVFLKGKEGRVGFQNQISTFISTMPLARKLNQLENHLIEFFYLPEIEDDTVWENDRNEFLKSMGEG